MIIDSCVLIDVSRKLSTAVAFLATIEAAGVSPAISALSVTEIMRGVRKESERLLFEALFERWSIIPINFQIALVAADYLKRYRASHHLDIIDALIAATVSNSNQPFITLNIKHFPMFPDLQRPY